MHTHLGRNTLVALALLALGVNMIWMLGLERVMIATSPDTVSLASSRSPSSTG